MKANGRLEDWEVIDDNQFSNMKGKIFGLDSGLYPDGSEFNMFVATEPPYFKSRIVRTGINNFYVLGEPLNKEDNLV